MRNIQLFFVALIASCFSSCEDVVNVDLNTAAPKLVIEASINWYKGSPGNKQLVLLSTTADYYSTIIPKVTGATVYVKNSSNMIFDFEENPDTGQYICTDFVPELNETYTLTVINEGQTYTATETLKPVAPITKIVQNNQGGFTGKDIQIKTFYNDPSNENNYYLYSYQYSNQVNSSYYVDEDTFFQGNEFFSISQNDKLKSGDRIEISHYGISKTYYNYMQVLVSITGNSNGSPFQAPPATLRGNIINTTNFNNYALGYFALSEIDIKDYVVQ